MNVPAPDFQKYMTLTDCPYCHTTPAVEIAKNPRVVRCINCGLYRLQPRMNKEGQIAYLKQTNDTLDDLTERGNPLDVHLFDLEEVRELKRHFPGTSANGKALDVGTGEGRFVAALRHNGAFEATGLEPLPKVAELGKNAGLDIHVGRFESDGMPQALEGQVFDVVCLREVICYMADLRESFDLLRRVLRPGGGLYIKCHVPTSICYWKNKDYLLRYGLTVTNMPTLAAMTKILAGEGYQILKTGYYQFNVLRSLGVPGAYSFFGGIIGYRLLSPVVRFMGKADRMFILARRL